VKFSDVSLAQKSSRFKGTLLVKFGNLQKSSRIKGALSVMFSDVKESGPEILRLHTQFMVLVCINLSYGFHRSIGVVHITHSIKK